MSIQTTGMTGLEPVTFRLTAERTTNCATSHCVLFSGNLLTVFDFIINVFFILNVIHVDIIKEFTSWRFVRHGPEPFLEYLTKPPPTCMKFLIEPHFPFDTRVASTSHWYSVRIFTRFN
jgi:hypothetical protein